MLKILNCNLKEYNSYKVEAFCRVAYFIDSEEDIKNIFNVEKDVVIIGSGHNIILSKKYYDSAFIIMAKEFSKITELSGDRLHVQAGVFTKDLAEYALKKSLSGVEVFYDIPSSIGGAVVMNAGASGEEICNLVELVTCYNVDKGEFIEFDNKQSQFSYRNSFFQQNKNLIVLSAVLCLSKGIEEEISKKMSDIKELRHSKQPKDFPNAGSVFKRPEGRFVGPMLDELELKGYTIGGAQVSKKHSGFIVNIGDAEGKDILNLISYIQKLVYEKFEVILEVEQRII
ncbi:UDP-N-acetylmuramate dehydrogenase [Myroides fluvii]|uniref:UDP-N-acetylmuramate dehydrogenase n=1 Tax=Myroides fluvii TaxID=2572594 RepID=UPI00131D7E65|nr:UDP-N-acetylmuramate dehydrogenase [Myroides fluvii]